MANETPYIGYNNSGIVNLDSNETGIKMLDKLTRIKDDRRLKPLDQSDSVVYTHRYMYPYKDSNFNLLIGDTFFIIPPEFIMINSEATSQDIVTLRQENTQKMKSGYHKRTILIDLVFNGLNQINGYPVDGPEGTYYVDGLRQLLAQFKCTPFLPITNELINGTYGICTVALQSITMRTVQGFPDVIESQITLQEVEMFPYIQMPNQMFKYMIDWDLFRFYYQRFLTENHEPKKLQSIPPNKEHNKFKISILDESVFSSESATSYNMLQIINDEKIVKTLEDGKTLDTTNYTEWLNSETDAVSIVSFQCGYSNLLTNIQLSECSSPTVQFMGGMDTIYNITLETMDYTVVQALEQCQMTNDVMIRGNRKLHSVGFVKLESELIEFTGSSFVMIEFVASNTVPGFPGLYNVQIQCVAYDTEQSERESLNGFMPFECDKDGRCGEFGYNEQEQKYGYVSDHNHEEQAIEQSMKGLELKIKQDAYAEWKLRSTMEVYPDLRLPKYNEVDEVITKIREFRKKYGLSQLEYEKYPKSPTYTLHGLSINNSISFEHEENGIIIDTNTIDDSTNEYDGYVDPDFYVFYPCSYLSFLKDDEECYGLYSPSIREGYTKIKVQSFGPNYSSNGTTIDNSDLASQFIEFAKQYEGNPYVWGAVGDMDSNGRLTFDCSGFVTFLLRTLGVISSSRRITTSSIPADTDIFKEVPWDSMKKGDLLVRPSSHVAIYMGDDKIIHAANMIRDVVIDTLSTYNLNIACKLTKCYRVKAFETTNSNINQNNASGVYLTDYFIDFIKKWEGYMPEAKPKDGGIDIGYGFHNQYYDGTKYVKITSGMKMSEAEAEKYLRLEMLHLIPKTIEKLKQYGWNVSDFTNNQILALTSYYYNRGYSKKADSILIDSKTIQEIGNNFPKYWGSATYAKNGLINRRNGEKLLFFTPDSNSSGNADDTSSGGGGGTSFAVSNTLTIAEFDSICRVIMAITNGETTEEDSELEKAFAQLIYDRLTHPDRKFGSLSTILNTTSDFPSIYQGELNSTIVKNVESVFCNNNKFLKDSCILYYVAPELNSTGRAILAQSNGCKKLKEKNSYGFWGKKEKGSSKEYEIVEGVETGSASINNLELYYEINHEATNIAIEKFGQPVFVKTDAIIYDETWMPWEEAQGKISTEKLNSTENTFGSSFCDEVQYSSRGRLLRAFPTYLFCILDDDSQWYDGRKLWTNYYVHHSVIDISVHATNDMPTETATITVSNSYHNLDRVQGGLSSYSLKKDSNGRLIFGDENGYSNLQLAWYNFTGMMLGFGPKLTDKLIKLHQIIYNHAKLREGARIHLRMGYGSDPLSLAPVMNGHVSDLSLGDQITVVVTSDGHELVQHITSASKNDTNNGWFGLFGLGEHQESSNIIAEIMCERQSWVTHLMGQTFEGSKYSIEHFGLYFNQTLMRLIGQYVLENIGETVVGGANVGQDAGKIIGLNIPIISDVTGFAGLAIGSVIGAVGGTVKAAIETGNTLIRDLWNGNQEQYDLLKNIYKANYKRQHYIYTTAEIGSSDEQNVVFNKYNMTPWDCFQICTQQVPEYIVKPSYHQFDSRLYFGLPSWLEKYRYDYLNGKVYEECKTSAQSHFIDSLDCIIDNQVRVTSKYSNTNVKVIYTRGSSAVSTQVIHSDDTIDFSKQKTTILDSPICQDIFGPDVILEALGYNIGEESARRIGISNLLYGWQQQYQGQLLLLGHPGLKPHDYMMINDTYANLYGVALVREVTHSFNTNTGFTTSVVPGMIGFSTDEHSGMIETTKNYLYLLNCFSSYTQIRKNLLINYEKNIGVVNDLETMKEKLIAAVNYHSSLDVLGTATTVVLDAITIPVLVKTTKQTFSFIKGLYNLGKSGKIAKTFLDGYTDAKKTIKGFNAVIKGGKGIKATISAIKAGTIATGTAAGGFPGLIAAIVWVAIDILISDVITWFSNKNVCVLLPLWWEGYPFVAGVKDGEKILLMDSNSTATSENTRADRIEVEDN